jgi:hypothetical protein
MTVVWNATPVSAINHYDCFGGICYHHSEGRRPQKMEAAGYSETRVSSLSLVMMLVVINMATVHNSLLHRHLINLK